ncbi:MAG: hypothetical protein N2202_09535, partial [Proteobacteria bacterium]|nr:hypothetical protein [Pseudomonadota bacterium]
MIKILFHANDYEGLKSYAKILNKVSQDISTDWIYDRDLFLEKVRNDYDLIFLVVLNYTEDLLILKEIYNLNKDIPII